MRPCTLSASSRAPSQNQWAAFFHQATLGTNLNYDFSSHLVKVSDRSSWSSSHVLRVAPESVKDLENFVLDFFRHLGPATIVGISLFEDGYCSLLRELLSYGASTHAWLMFSRIQFLQHVNLWLFFYLFIQQQVVQKALKILFLISQGMEKPPL